MNPIVWVLIVFSTILVTWIVVFFVFHYFVREKHYRTNDAFIKGRDILVSNGWLLMDKKNFWYEFITRQPLLNQFGACSLYTYASKNVGRCRVIAASGTMSHPAVLMGMKTPMIVAYCALPMAENTGEQILCRDECSAYIPHSWNRIRTGDGAALYQNHTGAQVKRDDLIQRLTQCITNPLQRDTPIILFAKEGVLCLVVMQQHIDVGVAESGIRTIETIMTIIATSPSLPGHSV